MVFTIILVWRMNTNFENQQFFWNITVVLILNILKSQTKKSPCLIPVSLKDHGEISTVQPTKSP